MSTLKSLKAAKSLSEVAVVLRYKPSALSFILYQIDDTKKYSTFEIPKKSGGKRRIDAPIPRLKKLQRRFANVLYECAAEIEATSPPRKSISHAFRKAHSILTNARPHKNRRFVFNLDLKDFFPSFNFGRVRGFFLKNSDFALHDSVATVLAQIACNDGKLPQGSPCSPILSELLAHFLDVRLAQFAKIHKCTYSRYADDITFSTNRKHFPKAIGFQKGTDWKVGKQLRSKIKDAGFAINAKKTQMHYRISRQSVTGLVVNEKINVRSEYYRSARAMANSLFSKGAYHRVDDAGTSIKSPAQLIGLLNHVYHVREHHVDLQIANEKDDAKKKELVKAVRDRPSAIRRLLYRALFFNHFVALDKPLVVCEGKTDVVYLNAALRKLVTAHPTLAVAALGKVTRNVRFFNYSNQARNVLHLGGGTGDLKNLLLQYKELAEGFTFSPMEHPVIIFIDNDKGATPIFGVIKNVFHVTITLATKLPFYHLWKNLYLVKTSEFAGSDPTSYVENFFEPSLLKTIINGKTLNLNKEHQAPGEYGKHVFAEQVVKPNLASINFSGFSPILSRIQAVINDYKLRK